MDRATGEKVIAQLHSDAAATRAAISGAFYFDNDVRDSDLGAVRIVEDTSIKALSNTLGDTIAGVKSDRAWYSLACTAEDSLKAINHYAGDATVRTILAATADATAADVKKGAQAAADVARDVAGSALSIAWSALPGPAKALVVLGGVGAAVFVLVQIRVVVAGAKAATGAA